MSDFEEKVSILLGLIVLDNPLWITRPPLEDLYESAAVYAIISRLSVGDIESALRIYTHNGEGVQRVIYNHLLFISSNGYREYKLKLISAFS